MRSPARRITAPRPIVASRRSRSRRRVAPMAVATLVLALSTPLAPRLAGEASASPARPAALAPTGGAAALSHPAVGVALTTDGNGAWVVGSDGAIMTYGDATFLGSMGGHLLASPIVGIAATPTGRGYWLVASDGGIFSFGDAAFHGSMGGRPLVRPIVGMASTPGGHGYWTVASDGGIFAFGDAGFYGSMGGTALVAPIVGISAMLDGHGYRLVGADGGVFSFGDATFAGRGAPSSSTGPVVGLSTGPGGIYQMVTTSGTIVALVAETTIAPADLMLSGINQARAAAGVAPVAPDTALGSIASTWSGTLASTGTLLHQDLSALLASSLSSYHALGEILYDGPASSPPQAAVDAWMASPDHRTIMLSSAYSLVGVGTTTVGGTIYAVVDFGAH